MHKVHDDRIDYLKAIAIALVIACHVFGHRIGLGDAPVWMPPLNVLIGTIHVPLFFAVAGWLWRPQPFAEYMRRKTVRVLVPFAIFSLLKIVYSSFISPEFAHGEGWTAQLIDAFLFGRLYWFAYAIFVAFIVALAFGCLSLRGLAVAWLGTLALAFVSPRLPSVFQLPAAAALLPCLVLGMIARRLDSTEFCSESPRRKRRCRNFIAIFAAIVSGAYVAYLFLRADASSDAPRIVQLPAEFALIAAFAFAVRLLPRGIGWLAFIGRNAWAIMFLDSFFKAVLVRVIPVASFPLLVIVLDIALCALLCKFLERLPHCGLLGVSSRIGGKDLA